jgi:hypothetical protein
VRRSLAVDTSSVLRRAASTIASSSPGNARSRSARRSLFSFTVPAPHRVGQRLQHALQRDVLGIAYPVGAAGAWLLITRSERTEAAEATAQV